jgi:hypothetical protein
MLLGSFPPTAIRVIENSEESGLIKPGLAAITPGRLRARSSTAAKNRWLAAWEYPLVEG